MEDNRIGTPSLEEFDLIVVNSSAGKDSQTALSEVVRQSRIQNEPLRKVVVSHQDLGHMEWPGTKDLAEKQAEAYGLRFEVSKYRDKDGEYRTLLEYIRRRGKWPDNQNRYCTSEFKRGPGSRVITMLSKELRKGGKHRPRILHVFGFRAEESPARAKKPAFVENARLSRSTQEVWDWLPIHRWKETKVWDDIKGTMIKSHYAYTLGMPRLSCIFCIFAPRAALIIAGKARPDMLNTYVELEKEINHDFRQKTPIREIREAILEGEVAGCTDGAWNM